MIDVVSGKRKSIAANRALTGRRVNLSAKWAAGGSGQAKIFLYRSAGSVWELGTPLRRLAMNQRDGSSNSAGSAERFEFKFTALILLCYKGNSL